MMTTDQKIDEVLKAVREQGERQDRSEEKVDELIRIVKGHEVRFDRLEAKDDELSKQILEQREFFLEERTLNNKRFLQMENSINGLQGEVSKMNTDLNAKIDGAHESLSADILGLGEELYETKRRMTLKKKSLS